MWQVSSVERVAPTRRRFQGSYRTADAILGGADTAGCARGDASRGEESSEKNAAREREKSRRPRQVNQWAVVVMEW